MSPSGAARLVHPDGCQVTWCGIGLLRVSTSLLGAWHRVLVGGLLYSVHRRSR